jgi:hypothetical protein
LQGGVGHQVKVKGGLRTVMYECLLNYDLVSDHGASASTAELDFILPFLSELFGPLLLLSATLLQFSSQYCTCMFVGVVFYSTCQRVTSRRGRHTSRAHLSSAVAKQQHYERCTSKNNAVCLQTLTLCCFLTGCPKLDLVRLLYNCWRLLSVAEVSQASPCRLPLAHPQLQHGQQQQHRRMLAAALR